MKGQDGTSVTSASRRGMSPHTVSSQSRPDSKSRAGIPHYNLKPRCWKNGAAPDHGVPAWIALDVTDHLDGAEVAALALQSYRHFALKRMLQQLT